MLLLHVGCSWWSHHTVAARLVVGLSLLQFRWNGTRFQTLFGVPTASNRRWKHIFLRCKMTISASEALRDALYKSTITTTTTTLRMSTWLINEMMVTMTMIIMNSVMNNISIELGMHLHRLLAFSDTTLAAQSRSFFYPRFQFTVYTGWPKNKPLPNDQKIVLNHIKACQWD